MEIIKPITLMIDRNLWNEFKISIPRNIKLNDAIVDLIKKHLKK